MDAPDRVALFPLRIVALAGVTTAFVLSGWQISRSIDEQPRLNSLAYGSMISGIIGAVAIVVWTWAVARNALSVLAPARTQEPPRPSRAALTWLAPMTFITAAAGSVAYLSRRLNTPIEGTESSIPLMLAVAAMLIALPLMYSPVMYLSWVVRKVGGHGVTLIQWVWVPIALAAVGAAMVFGLRAGGAFGDDPDGLAPPWAVGVVAIIPATVVLLLGWRAAAGVETDIARAYDRRSGASTSTSSRSGKFSSMYADDGPNHAALRDRGHIRQVPGGNMIGVIITAGLAGLAMTSVIGALVMFLFWQETRDGVLESEQNERAWELLALLQDVERTVAFVVLAVAAIWTFITITNVRMASARRRNPIVAGISWPVAAAVVWIIGDRFVVDGATVAVVAGFFAQAAVLYVPFFLLERGADAVGTRRNPLRITCAIGIILLVHVQGLGGLSTLSQTSEPAEVGRLAAYLTIGALVQLLAMFAATDANRSLADAAKNVADQHNLLVEQRDAITRRNVRSAEASRARAAATADRVGASS